MPAQLSNRLKQKLTVKNSKFKTLLMYLFLLFYVGLIYLNVKSIFEKVPEPIADEKMLKEIQNSRASRIANLCATKERERFDKKREVFGRYDSLSPNNIYDTNSEYGTNNEQEIHSKSYTNGYPKFSRPQKYFFAVNFYNNEEILPNFVDEIIKVFEVLGYNNVFFSIFESGSVDDTKLILRKFAKRLRILGIGHKIIMQNEGKPQVYHRIEYLAGVRNKVMKPFYDLYQKTSHFSIYSDSNQKNKFDKIVFINDVMFCRNDILELILQSYIHGADITCPLDLDFYDETGKNPDEKRFRDTWVARDINGNAFKKTLDKMVSDERGTERMKKYQPFQVQCCWNGIAILNPRPFEAPTNLQFRRSKVPSNECAASECSLLCNDFWRLGYNKVVVVPGVQVAYDTKEFSQLEKYYSNMTRDQIFDTTPIKFQEGPEFVECSPLTKYNFRDPEKFTVSIDYLAQP